MLQMVRCWPIAAAFKRTAYPAQIRRAHTLNATPRLIWLEPHQRRRAVVMSQFKAEPVRRIVKEGNKDAKRWQLFSVSTI